MVCEKSYSEDKKKRIRKAAERRKLRAEFWVSKLMGESQRWGHLSGVGRALWLKVSVACMTRRFRNYTGKRARTSISCLKKRRKADILGKYLENQLHHIIHISSCVVAVCDEVVGGKT